jgi:hypothetical protein
MSEREIRNIVRSICNDLDERARRAAQARLRKVVLPAALGVTLAVAGCASDSGRTGGEVVRGDSESTVVDAAAGKDAANTQTEGTAGAAGSTSGGAGNIAPTAVAIYGVQIAGSGATGGSGPVTPLDASTDGGTSPDAGAPRDAGSAVDSGIIPPYMAPPPDTGIGVELYAAPPPDATVMALYMASFPGK